MTRYIGLWHGGPSYSEGYWATDAEVFESLAHALHVLRIRATGRRVSMAPRVAEWSDSGVAYAGAVSDSLTPAADGSSLLLAPVATASLESLEADGPYACSHLLEVGPRGGVKVTRL